MFTCLFANKGADLRGALRAGATDEQMYEMIRDIWLLRSDQYSALRSTVKKTSAEQDRVEMYHIGG